jgi:hypothetical protein
VTPGTPLPYRRVQFGGLIVAASVLGLLFTASLAFTLSPATLATAGWMLWVMAGVLLLAVLLNGWLTVEVTADELRARLGIGFYGRRIPVSSIVRCDAVRTRVWWGWGVHWTPSGWLYNVSGRDAVRLEIRAERPVMFGTGDLAGLKTAIDAAMAAAGNRDGRH